MTQKDREALKRRIQKRERRKGVPPHQKYISDKTLADRWEVSRDTIWRWSREGKIPKPRKIGENCTRWDIDDIETHEAAQEAAT